jgi:hypothetical protein
LSTLDAPAYEVLVRRAAKVVLEDALYPVRTTSCDPGEIGDSDAGLQVGGNMPLDATHQPRCDAGALRHDPVEASATAWTPSSSNEMCVIAIIIVITIAHEFVLCRIRVASPTRSIIVGAIGALIARIVVVDRHVLGDERLRFVTRCGRAVGAEQVFKPLEQEFATGNTGGRCSGMSEEAGRSSPAQGFRRCGRRIGRQGTG